MPTRAQIIDRYFGERDYYSHVPFKALGGHLVDVCVRHATPPAWPTPRSLSVR